MSAEEHEPSCRSWKPGQNWVGSCDCDHDRLCPCGSQYQEATS